MIMTHNTPLNGPPIHWSNTVSRNLARLHADIHLACRRARRPHADVRLVAVTKYAPLQAINALLSLGVADLGESHVQQLLKRAVALGHDDAGWIARNPSKPRWHMIGHLQRNKVNALLAVSRIVHSLDSLRLAEKLSERAAALNAPIDVFVEVNVSGEPAKTGVPPADAPRLVDAASRLPALTLRGLMTMAPYDPNPESARPCFSKLRELSHQIRRAGAPPTFTELSMGMSGDYLVAIEEGATVVRIGSALFHSAQDAPPSAADATAPLDLT